jgi:hypothetical protein
MVMLMATVSLRPRAASRRVTVMADTVMAGTVMAGAAALDDS